MLEEMEIYEKKNVKDDHINYLNNYNDKTIYSTSKMAV